MTDLKAYRRLWKNAALRVGFGTRQAYNDRAIWRHLVRYEFRLALYRKGRREGTR